MMIFKWLPHTVGLQKDGNLQLQGCTEDRQLAERFLEFIFDEAP